MKLDIKTIGYINAFENLTRVGAKDCFFDKNDNLVFIVKFGKAGMAIGRNGTNIKRLGNMLKKRIKIIEFNNNIVKFVGNAINPLKAEIREEDKIVIIKAMNTQDKAKLIGRDKQNLKALQELVSKYFDYEVKIE